MSHEHEHDHDHEHHPDELLLSLVGALREAQDQLNLANMTIHILKCAMKQVLPYHGDNLVVNLGQTVTGPSGNEITSLTIFRDEDGFINLRE